MDPVSNLSARQRAAETRHESPAPNSFFDDEPEARHSNKKPIKTYGGLFRTYKKPITIAVCLLLFVVALRFLLCMMSSGAIVGVKKDLYQAVFLTDGTQYVGRLVSLDDTHYKLTNAFYVSASQTPVASDKSSQASGGQVALVKLEAGLLTAENEIIIPKDKVLLYENLKADGQAAKLIDSNK